MALTAARYIEVLNDLYNTFRLWYAPDHSNMGLQFHETEHALQDDNNGNYTAPGLVLTRGGHQIEVLPRGCVLVGADARVDMVAGIAPEILVYDEETGWSHVDRAEFRILHTLNQERFYALVEALMR